MESCCATQAIIKEVDTKTDLKDDVKHVPQFIERPRDGFYLRKNMQAMTMLGWDKNGLIDAIKSAGDINPKIDPNITIMGAHNPLVNMYVGFSTRKLYDAMLRKKKVIRYVLIIEPNLAVFKNLISTEDITDLLLNPDFDFILGVSGKELIPKLFQSFTKQVYNQPMSRSVFIESKNCIVDPFVYNTPELQKQGQEIVDLSNAAVQQLKLSMGCSDDQYRRFEMLFENKQNMYNSWKINNLYGKFSDVPIFVLGGGPSIDDFINEYKSNSSFKNALIICVDAVLHKLLSHGIKPHIVTRCERKLTNIFKGVTKEMTKGIYYAAYPWTPKEFFNLFDDSFYLFRQNGVCLFTELSHGFVDGGVSSGNAALELAINLGSRNIILSGIDLCFIDGRTHTDGTQVEFNIERSKEKWFELPTNNGGKGTSIPVWERCRNEYMQSIDKHTRKGRLFNVFNTSEKGAVIPLTKYQSIKELGYLCNKEVDVTKIIEENRIKLTKEEVDKFEIKIKETIIKLKEYLEQTNVALGLIEDTKRTAHREIKKLVEQIKATIDEPYDLVRAIRSNNPNYEKLMANISDSIDQNFKKKLYGEQQFRVLIFDVLQLDLYYVENVCHSLVNQIDNVDERHDLYVKNMRDFMLKVKHYLTEFINLLKEFN